MFVNKLRKYYHKFSRIMNSGIVGLGDSPAKIKNGDNDQNREKQETMTKNLNDSSSSEYESKRNDYLSWPDYYMAVACLSAQRSKDPHTQVGACIVNEEKKIVGIGYNGMPVGCSDDNLPWNKLSDSPLDTKYPYVCHAEMNAIMNKNAADVKGCTMYVALFPCNECAKLIIQSGIKKIIYMRDKPEKPEMIASKRMFDMCHVEYQQFKSSTKRVVIEFSDEVEPQCRIEMKNMAI